MFGLRQFSWSGQNLLEEITDTTENLMKWNILLVKGKKINRDFESSGERNWNLSLMQDACIFFICIILIYAEHIKPKKVKVL